MYRRLYRTCSAMYTVSIGDPSFTSFTSTYTPRLQEGAAPHRAGTGAAGWDSEGRLAGAAVEARRAAWRGMQAPAHEPSPPPQPPPHALRCASLAGGQLVHGWGQRLEQLRVGAQRGAGTPRRQAGKVLGRQRLLRAAGLGVWACRSARPPARAASELQPRSSWMPTAAALPRAARPRPSHCAACRGAWPGAPAWRHAPAWRGCMPPPGPCAPPPAGFVPHSFRGSRGLPSRCARQLRTRDHVVRGGPAGCRWR